MNKFIVITNIFEDEAKTKFIKSGHIIVEAENIIEADKKFNEIYPYTDKGYIGMITEEITA